LAFSFSFTDDSALFRLLGVVFARYLSIASVVFGILLGLIYIWLLVVCPVILLSSHTFAKNRFFLSTGRGKLLGSWLSRLLLLYVFCAPTLLIASSTSFDCTHEEIKLSRCFLLGLLTGIWGLN